MAHHTDPAALARLDQYRAQWRDMVEQTKRHKRNGCDQTLCAGEPVIELLAASPSALFCLAITALLDAAERPSTPDGLPTLEDE